jgi:hypothetical protein
MKRPPACDCHCGCCVPASTTGIDWDTIPQRFQIDTDPWSWSMPEGMTHSVDKYPVLSAFDNFNMYTFAKSLDTVGASNVAWILAAPKYSEAFGSPTTFVGNTGTSNPYGTNSTYGAFQWTAADHDGLIQYWYDAQTFAIPPGMYLGSHIKPMLDTSLNESGSTAFAAINVDGAYYDEFWDEMTSSYFSDEDIESTVCTFGSSQRIYIQRMPDGQCYWVCLVTLKPRYSMTMSHFGIRTKWVAPAVSRVNGSTGYTVPPYLINEGLGNSFPPQPDIGFDEDSHLKNWGGPLDMSYVTSKSPGGWRSWIEVAYVSDSPVNCSAHIQDMEPFTLTLVETVSRISLGPPQPTWSQWLEKMNQAYGLEAPPTTMTIQRPPDIV